MATNINSSRVFLLACKNLFVIEVVIVIATFVSTTDSQSSRVYRARSSATVATTESTTILSTWDKTTESSLQNINTNTNKGIKENSSNKHNSKKRLDEFQNAKSSKINKTRSSNKTEITSADSRNTQRNDSLLSDNKYGAKLNTTNTTDSTGDFNENSKGSKNYTASGTSDEDDDKDEISLIGRIGKKEFYYTNQNMRFGGAIEFCVTHDMTLAAIESEYENNLLKNFYESVDEDHKNGWLGATDGFMTKGEFRWLHSGKPMNFSSWESNYPSSDEKTSCVNFHRGKWKNWSCDGFGSEDNSSSYMRPICQKDIS